MVEIIALANPLIAGAASTLLQAAPQPQAWPAQQLSCVPQHEPSAFSGAV
ncbi:hypothetical protein [Dokdonella soli]